MAKYRSSRYNHLLTLEDGSLLISNELYGTYLKFSSENAPKVLAILKGLSDESDLVDGSIGTILVDKHLLVDEQMDEKAFVDYLCNNMVYSNDVLYLTIIPTDDCNFRCRYCYQEGKKSIMSANTVGIIKKYLARNLHRFNGLYVSWFGGEPLIAKDIVVEIMNFAHELCKQQKIPLYGQMTTNGYNLTPELFEELRTTHVLSYAITIDGNRETHNYQRPHATNPDSYTVILNNLRGIRDRNTHRNFRIGIRINVSPVNLPILDEYVDFMGEEFGNDRRFGIIWEWVKDWGGERICANSDLVLGSYSDTQYDRYLEYITQKGLQLDGGQAFKQRGTDVCIASRKNGFVLNHDGRVYKCSMAFYRPEAADVNCIGFLSPNGSMVIDEYKNSQWVGQGGNLSETCGECQHYPECMGLICPLTTRIRGKFQCSFMAQERYDYIQKNRDALGLFTLI